MSKEIVLFLHGKGADKNAHHDFAKALAQANDAKLVTLNAPFLHKQGYSWFGKANIDGVRRLDEDEFHHSLSLIKNELLGLNVDMQQVTICGHSQGGALAIAVGLELPLKKVISICGDIPFEVSKDIKTPAAEFVWIEGGKDVFLSEERKKSYQKLAGRGLNFRYLVDENTEHDVFSGELLDKL